MSAAPATTFYTIEQYLEMEENSVVKHEYYEGEVFAMAGASINHNRIVRNTQTKIDNFLETRSCEIFPGDLRIYIEAKRLFTYPDLSIFCDPIQPYNKRTDTATNPTVIIEVLSPSTEDYDRGTKFMFYRSIPTLKEYIIISSGKILVEKFTRKPDNDWNFKEYKSANETLVIEAINLELSITDLYRKVSFKEK